jgi:hypothetical protein
MPTNNVAVIAREISNNAEPDQLTACEQQHGELNTVACGAVSGPGLNRIG